MKFRLKLDEEAHKPAGTCIQVWDLSLFLLLSLSLHMHTIYTRRITNTSSCSLVLREGLEEHQDHLVAHAVVAEVHLRGRPHGCVFHEGLIS